MPKYNHSYEEIDGTVYEHWTDRGGNEHTYIEIGDAEECYDDDGEEGCNACGNPAYPYCKDSCPLFDD